MNAHTHDIVHSHTIPWIEIISLLKHFQTAWLMRKLSTRKYIRNINDNVVQGRLSENYVTRKIIARNILDTKYSLFTVHDNVRTCPLIHTQAVTLTHVRNKMLTKTASGKKWGNDVVGDSRLLCVLLNLIFIHIFFTLMISFNTVQQWYYAHTQQLMYTHMHTHTQFYFLHD
jgi:hypothetical protein